MNRLFLANWSPGVYPFHGILTIGSHEVLLVVAVADRRGDVVPVKNLLNLFVGFLVLASSPFIGGAQAATSVAVPGTPVMISWSVEGNGTFDPDKVQKISVRLQDKSGKPSATGFELTGFDARMPEHNHGMVTKPVVNKVSSSEFVVDGVKLHMTGKWVLEFKVSDKSVKVPVEIK